MEGKKRAVGSDRLCPGAGGSVGLRKRENLKIADKRYIYNMYREDEGSMNDNDKYRRCLSRMECSDHDNGGYPWFGERSDCDVTSEDSDCFLICEDGAMTKPIDNDSYVFFSFYSVSWACDAGECSYKGYYVDDPDTDTAMSTVDMGFNCDAR